MSRNHYFYLSFESAHCEDYITEKFFRILNLPVVPIVMGDGNYQDFVPKSAYIDVNDFETVEKLANRLKFLMNHKVNY